MFSLDVAGQIFVWVQLCDSERGRLLYFCFVSSRIRKIKEHDSHFTTRDFAERAQEIFIEAHNCLAQ